MSVFIEDGMYVVNFVGYLWGFLVGVVMGYVGFVFLFIFGKKFFKSSDDGCKNLEDVGVGLRKMFVMFGLVFIVFVVLCVVVLFKRILDVDLRDVF